MERCDAKASDGVLSLVVAVTIMSIVPHRSASLATTCVALLYSAVGVMWRTELKRPRS